MVMGDFRSRKLNQQVNAEKSGTAWGCMAYKYKATMYYSDEETEAFLRGKAVKSNGKKVRLVIFTLWSLKRERI